MKSRLQRYASILLLLALCLLPQMVQTIYAQVSNQIVPLSVQILVVAGQLDPNSAGVILDSDVYGSVVHYQLKKGHTLSISDADYVFSVRKLADGNYSTMLKEATNGDYTAAADMTVACLIRKPDKSALTAEELASVHLRDTQYGMVNVPGYAHRFTVEAQTISGGTQTTRAAIFLPESYSQSGAPTRLIIMTNGRHGFLKDSVWNANTDDDVGVIRHYMGANYAVLVVDNTIGKTNGAPDWGNPQLVSSYWKAYEYVQEKLNVEERFSLHSRSMGTFAAVRMMQEHPELIRCALMCGPVLSLKSRFGQDPAFLAKRYGFDDTTGATWEADKVVGYDPYTDVDGAVYSLPPTFWMMAQADATSAHLATIEKIKAHGNDVTTKLYTDTDHSGVCRLNIEACRTDSLAFLEAHRESDEAHRFCAWEISKAATCTDSGEARRECADCDYFEVALIPALPGHVFTDSETKCDSCGALFDVIKTQIPVVPGKLNVNTNGTIVNSEIYGAVVNYTLKAGHTLSVSDGGFVFSVRVLKNGNYSTMLKAATADSFTATEDMVIGCLIRKPDKSAVTAAELAALKLYDTIHVAHAHSYQATVTAPTCTEQGYTTLVCTVCGDSKLENQTVDLTDRFHWNEGHVISATGGGMGVDGNWVASDYVDISAVDSIEIVTGDTVNAGTTLGIAFYDADKNYVSGVVHTDKKGTEYGILVHNLPVPDNVVYLRTTWYSVHHEKYAGATLHTFYCKGTGSAVPALGHSYVLTDETAPTCSAQGSKVYTCDACGDSYMESVNRAEHSYDDGSCTVCGVSILGSDWIKPEFAEGDYAMVVLPDTQNLVQYWPQIYYNQMQWIADNKVDLNIQAVLHMGDMVNINNDAQWIVCKNGTNLIQAAGIPWMPMRGNHDDSAWFNRYYDYATYGTDQSWFGGSYEADKLDHTYWFVTVGEREYMILSLGWAPSWDVLEWAKGVVEAHEEKSVILTCHAYMDKDGTLLNKGDSHCVSSYYPDYPDGDDVWAAFKDYGNVVLAMGGHIHSPDVISWEDQNGAGRDVTSLLFDRQNDDTGSRLGMIAVLTFHAESETVDINWYSTRYDALYRTKNQFSISVPDVCVHSFTCATVGASCIQGGGTRYTCTLCGYSYLEEATEPLGHNYTQTVVPPTCTEPGYTVYNCGRCGHSTFKDVLTDISDWFHWTNGKMIIATTGESKDYATWRASDYVDISGFDSIQILTADTIYATTSTGLAFYDSDKQYICGVTHTDGEGTEYGTMLHTIEIPENAVYLRSTWYADSHPNYETAFGAFSCQGIRTTVPALGHDYVDGICTGCGKYYVIFQSATISLAGNIAINFYVELGQPILDDERAFMSFTLPDGTTKTAMLSDAEVSVKNGVTRYVFTCEVHAKQMADMVVAQMHLGDGTAVGDSRSYSVVTYAGYIIAHEDQYSDYPSLVNLLKAMLNYGAYSQIHFGYNVNNLANANLNLSLNDVTLGEVEAYRPKRAGSMTGLEITSVALILRSETVLRFYYTLSSGYSIEDYNFVVNGQAVRPIYNQDNGRYYVDVTNIAAKDLDREYGVTVTNKAGTESLSVIASAMSYVYQVISSPTYFAEDVKDVVKAMYAYNIAANAYFK